MFVFCWWLGQILDRHWYRMLQHASGVTSFPTRALKWTLVYSYSHWYTICVHIQRCSHAIHVMYIFISLTVCVFRLRLSLFALRKSIYMHIYIYMLPHDQKRQMNMVDFFGGYQVTIEIMYMRSLFCIMWPWPYIMQLLYLCIHKAYPWWRVCSICI